MGNRFWLEAVYLAWYIEVPIIGLSFNVWLNRFTTTEVLDSANNMAFRLVGYF